MINVENQIKYWTSSAKADLETAGILVNNGKPIEGLFFCHLAIEKVLKAQYVKTHHELAPKIHKLHYLAEKVNIELSEEQSVFFGALMQYQIEGRYPEDYPSRPNKDIAIKLLKQTENTLQWLMKLL